MNGAGLVSAIEESGHEGQTMEQEQADAEDAGGRNTWSSFAHRACMHADTHAHAHAHAHAHTTWNKTRAQTKFPANSIASLVRMTRISLLLCPCPDLSTDHTSDVTAIFFRDISQRRAAGG